MASTRPRVSRLRPAARLDTRRVTSCALLAALALALAALEALLPMPAPVPGMKLGLANMVTVVAAFWLGPVDTLVIFLVRVVLAAMLTGQLATLPFSMVGGGCALVVTLAFARFGDTRLVRLGSMAAAVAHNAGQVGVAVFLTATPQIALYLPLLLAMALVTGFLTGTVTQALLKHVPAAGRRMRH